MISDFRRRRTLSFRSVSVLQTRNTSANNKPVTVRHTAWNKVMVRTLIAALLLSGSAPQVLAAWQCAGEACGTTPWVCCCISPNEAGAVRCADDPECGEAKEDCAEGDLATICPAPKCSCEMVVRASDSSANFTGTPNVAANWHPLYTPEQREPIALLNLGRSVRSSETRGPPRPIDAYSTLQLRGPPFA